MARIKFTKLIIPVIIMGIVISNTITIYNTSDQSYIIKGDLSAINDMYDTIEKEQQFEQAYLNNSTKVSTEDIKLIGNVIYNEARGCSKLEQSCVAWTILNRCIKYGASIESIVKAPNQFAYKANLKLRSDKANSILAECEALAKDVIIRFYCEQEGLEEVGRTLPKEYLYYWGDGKHNYFRTELGSYSYWDYSLNNPYESVR